MIQLQFTRTSCSNHKSSNGVLSLHPPSEFRMLIKKAGLFILSTALLIAASALSFSSGSAAFAPALSARADSSAQVSTERISKHVAFLASDKLQGRRAGTEFADQAAAYIEKEFKSYGLKTSSSGAFLQPFNFVASVRLGGGNSFQVRTASGARSLEVEKDFMPLAFSPSDPAAGEAVFAGYGISAPELQFDSYSGIDPKGKIVMILRGSPDGDNPHGRFAEYTQPGLEIQTKTLKAREKGARGVIFVSAEQ